MFQIKVCPFYARTDTGPSFGINIPVCYRSLRIGPFTDSMFGVIDWLNDVYGRDNWKMVNWKEYDDSIQNWRKASPISWDDFMAATGETDES